MFNSEIVPLYSFTIVYPQFSSFALGLSMILVSFVFFNIFLATLSLIINLIRFFFFLGVEKDYSYIEYADYFTFFIPFIAIVLFYNDIRFYITHFVYFFALLFINLFFGLS